MFTCLKKRETISSLLKLTNLNVKQTLQHRYAGLPVDIPAH